jgi:hypothetical protein
MQSLHAPQSTWRCLRWRRVRRTAYAQPPCIYLLGTATKKACLPETLQRSLVREQLPGLDGVAEKQSLTINRFPYPLQIRQ